jgi:hypothetical protein
MIYAHVLNRPGLLVCPVKKDKALPPILGRKLRLYTYYTRTQMPGLSNGAKSPADI